MSLHKPGANSKHLLFRLGHLPGPHPAHTPCRPKHGRLKPQILLEGTLVNADEVNYLTELRFPQEKVVHLLLTCCSQVFGHLQRLQLSMAVLPPLMRRPLCTRIFGSVELQAHSRQTSKSRSCLLICPPIGERCSHGTGWFLRAAF